MNVSITINNTLIDGDQMSLFSEKFQEFLKYKK